ncbi:MAG: pyruvate kinase [Steroidobacteraceae bacterium]|jgi:pyruvate kinase|nr:pyruvate kinase [Steroidobacteraceae bacterium]
MVPAPRRTKIVATLGPATDDRQVLADLIRAGVDVVRVNFSHGRFEDHARRVKLVRDAAESVGRYVGILGDLSGPKIRIDRFRDGVVTLREGERFTLDVSLDPNAGDQDAVGCAYKALPQDVHPGDVLLLNDGLIVLTVDHVHGPRVVTTVTTGGELSNNKGLNRRGGGLSAGALTDKDREDIKFAAELDLDYLAVSFPKSAEDMNEARELVRRAGGVARTVAKIERAEAIRHLDDIVVASDAVMVARGDLAVEVGYAGLTGLQKRIIRAARQKYRVVITATQMMESMIQNPVPTRAEVSDVSNAVLDGTDAVMLSAESAVGKYPLKAVEAMASVIEGAEHYQLEFQRLRQRSDEQFGSKDQAIAMAVMYTANHMDVKAIVALTESGSTPLWMSRIRSDIPIYAFTRHEATRRRVTLYRGVYPVAFDVTHTDPNILYPSIFHLLVELGLCRRGDLIIVTKGELTGVQGGTNSMKILEVQA